MKDMGCEVTAISSSLDKKHEALGLGAAHFIDSNDRDALRKVEYGFDLLICASSGGVDWERLLETLKKKGRLVLLGFPTVTLKPIDLVAHELSLTGSFLGSHAMMKETLAFAHAHGIKPMIELMDMSQANKAIKRVREHRARYRIVLFNKGS